jgi:hypothetical protein
MRSRGTTFTSKENGTSRRQYANFFAVTLPEIAGSLASRINDNFQVLKPTSLS